MTKTVKKLGAMLLALIVTFMPMPGVWIAYAEDEGNPVVAVFVGYVNEDGSISSDLVLLNSATPYYVNDSSSALETEPENWNAYFDAENGTLTLKNYRGCTVTTRTTYSGDLTIVLEGDNHIFGKSLNGIFGCANIEITSSTAGTLRIDTGREGSDSCYGIRSYSSGKTIRLSGDAKVDLKTANPAAESKVISICCTNISISDEAELNVEVVSGGIAYGFWGSGELRVETPHPVQFTGIGGSDHYAIAYTSSILMDHHASISIQQKGDSIEDIYNQSFEDLKEMLAHHGYGVTGSAEDGTVTASIEAITDMDPVTSKDILDQLFTGTIIEPESVVRSLNRLFIIGNAFRCFCILGRFSWH